MKKYKYLLACLFFSFGYINAQSVKENKTQSTNVNAGQNHLVENLLAELEYAPRFNSDYVKACRASILIDVFNNDVVYNGDVNGLPTQGNTSEYIDFTSFKFIDGPDNSTNTELGSKSMGIISYTVPNEGNWLYNELTGQVSFNPALNFVGKAKILYNAKGTASMGGPFNQEIYRSVPKEITVEVVDCGGTINPQLPFATTSTANGENSDFPFTNTLYDPNLIGEPVQHFKSYYGLGEFQSKVRYRFKASPYMPTGFYISPGSTLVLNVKLITGNFLPRIHIGTYKRPNSILLRQDLRAGENIIYSERGGLIWITYEKGNNPPFSEAEITFVSGYKEGTYFVKNKTTRAEWLERWDNLSEVNEVLLIGEKTVLVFNKSLHADVKTQDNNVILRNTDFLKEKVDEIAGFDGSSLIHSVYPVPHLMIHAEMGSRGLASNFNTSFGGVAPQLFSEDPSRNRAVDTAGHEMGHMYQQNDWRWGDVGHVTQEIFGRYAAKSWYNVEVGENLLYGSNLAVNFAFLEDNSPDKDWANFTGERFFMFLQLMSRPGGAQAFAKLHRAVRENRVNGANDDQKKQLFMIEMSKATGEDLSVFFKKWGFFPEGHQVYNTIAELNLPKPNPEPHLFPFYLKPDIELDEDAYYEIEAEVGEEDFVLTVNNQELLSLNARKPNNIDNQCFKPIKLDDGTYIFQSKSNPSMVLDVISTNNLYRICFKPLELNEKSQKWRLQELIKDGYINIKSYQSNNAYVDVYRGLAVENNMIIVYPCNGGKGQNFRLKKIAD